MKNVSPISLSIIALLLSLLAGGQYFGISKDVDQYYFFFDNLSVDYIGRFEPLFLYYSLAIRWVSSNFALYLFLLVITSISLKLYVLSKFRFFYIALLWYFLILFPLHELTQYRASIALGFLYMSFYMLSVNNKIIYPIFLFIASVFFHYSAIAFFPVILLWSGLGNSKGVSFVYVVIVIFSLLLAKSAITTFTGELNSTAVFNESVDPNIFSVRNLILFALVIIGVFGFKSIPKQSRPFFYVSIYGFILWWLFYDLPVFAHRLFEATFMSYFIWLSFMNGIYRLFSRVLMSILALYLAYSAFYLNPMFS